MNSGNAQGRSQDLQMEGGGGFGGGNPQNFGIFLKRGVNYHRKNVGHGGGPRIRMIHYIPNKFA